jgi:hypothetical protein
MYKLLPSTPATFDRVLCVEDQTFIRLGTDSAEENEYLKWLEAGNTPLPADAE